MALKVKSSVKVKDKGFKKLQRLSRKDALVKVGMIGGQDEDRKDGPTNIVVANAHEFGLGVPERSFIRLTVDQKATQHRRVIRNVGRQVASLRRTQKEGLEILGQSIVSDMRGTIRAQPGEWDELSDATVDRKGSDKALIDTGQMINSITFQVEGA